MVPWLIGLAGLLCGLLYDVYFKRTPLSWLPYTVAFPLLPTWVFVSAEAWSAMLWWVFPLAAGLGLALHLANQEPDIAGDRATGVYGFAQRIGRPATRRLAMAAFGAISGIAVLVVVSQSAA